MNPRSSLAPQRAANLKCDVIRAIATKLTINLFVYILYSHIGRSTAVFEPAGQLAVVSLSLKICFQKPKN